MTKRTGIDMARGSNAGWKVLAVGAALVALTAASVGAQSAPEVKKTGDLEVTVVVVDGKSLKSGTISAKTQRATVEDAGKAIRLTGVPVGRTAVTVEAQISLGLFKGSKRYLGVADTGVQENGLQKVTVSIAPVETIDDFCLACHPNATDPNYKPVPGVIIRDIHVSGKEFPAAKSAQYLGSVKQHNDRMARLEKEGKPHNLPMPLEERVVKVGGKDVKRIYFTCESCHTLHQPTPGGKYARAPFREKSDLCKICHF
jgi:hypothetical protein